MPAKGPSLHDFLLIAIPALGVVVTIVGIVVNRTLARRAFQATQYPDLELECPNSSDLGPVLALPIRLKNNSQVEALAVSLRVVVARGLRRVVWAHRLSDERMRPDDCLEDRISLYEEFLHVCPGVLLASDDPFPIPRLARRTAWRLRKGDFMRPPRIAVILTVSWRPPFYAAKPLSRTVRRRLTVYGVAANGAPGWECSAAWTIAWRPRTIGRTA